MPSSLLRTDGISENLFEVLRDASADRAAAPFLQVPGQPHRSYGDVFDRAARFATVLGQADVQPGDRVVVRVTKSADAVAIYLACLQFGAIYVPLNTTFTDAEVDYFVGDAEPALLVVDVDGAHHPRCRTESLGLGGTLSTLADSASPSASVTDRRGSDLAAMLYTSGTTGRSKGAMLTHHGLIANGRALNRSWGFTPDDVLLHSLPIFHVHGLFVALHCAMLSAAETIFLPRFDVDHVIDALPRATVLMGVPTHYVRLLADARFDRTAVRGMRLLTSGSAPMTEAVHRAVEERTGHRVLERYGMTEAGIITSNPLDGERVAGTVGYPLPEVELRIANAEGPCAPGEVGVVEVRGPHMFEGYWGLPDKTAEAHDDDGFFVTGDVGSLSPDGRLQLEGRAGDMIISGGENVYPREIELCLDEVDDIVEAAVVGVPHPDFGEAVVAFIVASPAFDADKAAVQLAGRLARFKQPKRYVVLDALPRNAMGKVQKATIRNDHLALFAE